ncbi:MAG: hypothetical protein JEZ07_00780 [Phycisphaerae bacterium]|nr:hypothetical protein [Phycisphaerae bacterium]
MNFYGYPMDAPIAPTKPEIEDFQIEFGIELPKAYIEFLEFSNGWGFFST